MQLTSYATNYATKRVDAAYTFNSYDNISSVRKRVEKKRNKKSRYFMGFSGLDAFAT